MIGRPDIIKGSLIIATTGLLAIMLTGGSIILTKSAVDDKFRAVIPKHPWPTEYAEKYAEKITADPQPPAKVENNAGEAGYGEQEGIKGTAEESKFPGYEVMLALFSCGFYALILKVWPILFGKHEEEHP